MAEHGLSGWSGDGRFDHLVGFLSRLCDVPIALVSLVEIEEQRFLGKIGLEVSATPRSTSFCAYAMHRPEVMVVPDARLDPRFADNPLVTGEPNIRFYAGAPLITRQGVPLGALCVIDTVPREGLTDLQEEGMIALATDVMAIIEARLIANQNDLVTRELDHRIKNLFALIGGLVHFSYNPGDPERGRDDLTDRIAALGRAHDLILKREQGGGARPTGMQALLDTLVAPYRRDRESRIVISGDDPVLDEESVTPIALIFHELTTNSAKYGALSAIDGNVSIAINLDGPAASIRWDEHGGPRLTDEERPVGFGSRLIDSTAKRQLGATIERDWQPDGLRVDLTLPLNGTAAH